MKYGRFILMCFLAATWFGCTGTSKPVQKIAKPVDQTAEELVKIRELKSDEGDTRAILSPADEKQLKIKF